MYSSAEGRKRWLLFRRFAIVPSSGTAPLRLIFTTSNSKQQLQYEYGYSDTDTPEEVDISCNTNSLPPHNGLGRIRDIGWSALDLHPCADLARAFPVAVTRPNLAPLYSYLLVNFVWDILYSPFGSVNRMVGGLPRPSQLPYVENACNGNTGSRFTQTGCLYPGLLLPSAILSLDWRMAYGGSSVLRRPHSVGSGVTDIEAHAMVPTPGFRHVYRGWVSAIFRVSALSRFDPGTERTLGGSLRTLASAREQGQKATGIEFHTKQMVLPCWHLRGAPGSVDQLGCHRTPGTVGRRDIWGLDRLVARSISGADAERFGGLPSDRFSNSLLWTRILLTRRRG